MKEYFFLPIAIIFWAPIGMAANGISASYGMYKHQQHSQRIAVQTDLPITLRENCLWQIKSFLEFSYLHAHATITLPNQVDSISALAIAPVFRFARQSPVWHTHPFLEVGVGLAWVSERSFAGRKLGIPHQFEDRIGAGFKSADWPFEVVLRYTHYSNAHMAYHNSGFNTYTFTLGYWMAE